MASKKELLQGLESFVDSYTGHNLAVFEVTEKGMTDLGSTLALPAKARGDKMAYLIVQEREGELKDADVEKVAGGLGDKYDADCSRALAIGSASMTVINIG